MAQTTPQLREEALRFVRQTDKLNDGRGLGSPQSSRNATLAQLEEMINAADEIAYGEWLGENTIWLGTRFGWTTWYLREGKLNFS